MEAADRSKGTLDRIRRLRGVSWEWREEAPVEAEGREAGVIAQEVQAVFPELVETGPDGYLRVRYRGLAARIAEAVVELSERLERLEGPASPPATLSDAGAKREFEPVQSALARLRSGQDLQRSDYTALVGALVEVVKELDARLALLEGGTEADRE
ncbi:MAG: tail fiber domain-containing protein [Solirubrobacterales bacterium]